MTKNYLKNSFARSPEEQHRAATPLELFFDLVYVVAIASAGAGLHHMLQEQHVWEGILWYSIAFMSIFWCWLNFAWYASAYDNDDTTFRLTTFLQIFGALVFSVGVANFFKPEHSLTVSLTGYVIMRVALAIHWFRAAKFDPQRRKTCLRYAYGIIIVQTLWVISYIVIPAEYQIYYIPILFLVEMMIPILGEGKTRELQTPWHPHHIAERYSLLVIIVLGEGILATTSTISSLINIETRWQEAFPFGFAAAALIFSLWWSYFKMPFGKILHHNKNSSALSFMFGYLHYFVFAALAAVGIGLQIIADRAESLTTKEFNFGTEYALMCVAVPLSVYLLMMSFYRTVMIRKSRYNWISWVVALFLPFISVVANFYGMKLEWALWLSLIAPVAFIYLNSVDDCVNENSESFKIED